MRMMLIAFVAAALAPATVAAQGARLDPSFGNGGLVEIQWPGSSLATSIAVDSSGRLLVGGDATSPDGDMDFAVFRLNPDGSIDSTYADDGFRLINFNPDSSGPEVRGWDSLYDLVVAGDEVTAVGTSYSDIHYSWDSRTALVRLDSDGALDPHFGDGGRVLFGVGSAPAIDAGWTLALDTRQRIVVAGRSARYRGNSSAYDYWLSLARLTPQGQLDPTFEGGGAYETTLLPAQPVYPPYVIYNSPGAMALDDRGHIVVPATIVSCYSDSVVYRTLPDGGADPDFASDGRLQLPVPYSSASAVLPLHNGSILVTGGNWVDIGTLTGGLFLLHVLKDGSIDPGFGIDGIGEITLPAGIGGGSLIAPVEDGGWLVAGSQVTGSSEIDNLGVIVARFDANGMPDTSFGQGGVAEVSLPDGSYFSTGDLALQPDGRLVAAGYMLDDWPSTSTHFAIARILIDSDNVFGDGFDGVSR